MAYDWFSDQLTRVDAAPPGKEEAYDSGKKYTKYFSFTTDATTAPAVGETIELARIEGKFRLLGGKLVSEAMSSAGGTAGLSVGDGTTAAKYLSAGNLDAAAEVEFGHTVALNYGELITDGLSLVGTVTGEDFAVSKQLLGEVSYLKLA